MDTLNDIQAEAWARKHLLDSGIVEQLKANKIFIWTLRADKGKRLYLAIDHSANPEADMDTIRGILTDFLSPLGREVEIKEVSIEENCCYGVCRGCLNGDPETKPVWIGPGSV